MMPDLTLFRESVLFIVLLGVPGWCAWHLLFAFAPEDRPGLVARYLLEPFFIFMTGFAVCSLGLIVFGVLGLVHEAAFAFLWVAILLLYNVQLMRKRVTHSLQSLSAYCFFLLLLLLICIACLSFMAPFEPAFYATDGTVFLGAAQYMAEEGAIRYHDDLVSEMTEQEIDAFFSKYHINPALDKNIRIRHQGGILLYETQNGSEVAAAFFPLFPLWLSLGVLLFGTYGFAHAMVLICALCILTFFLLGHRIAGALTGAAMAALFIMFFPFHYYFRMPYAETLCLLLLLAGLHLLLIRLDEKPGASAGQQALAAMLWGLALFTKLEILVFLPLFLCLIFSSLPFFSRHILRWKIFLSLFLLLLLGSAHYQFESWTFFPQIYLWCKDIPVIGFLFEWLVIDGLRRALLFTAIFLAVLAAFWWIERKNLRHNLFITARNLFFLAAIAIFIAIFIGLRFEGSKLTLFYEWISFYVPVWTGVILLIGIVLFLLALILRWQPRTFWVPFIFLLLPTVVYTIDPMIQRSHPFAVRRLIPVFFPLLFILSLRGYQLFSTRFVPEKRWFAPALFLIVPLLCLSAFWRDSSHLFKKPLYENLIQKVESQFRQIPEDALVIIPTRIGGHALQVGIQYLAGRETLVLPVTDEEGAPAFRSSIVPYVDRQLDDRRIFLVIEETTPPPLAINNSFLLHHEDWIETSFLHIPQSERFDSTPQEVELNYLLFELRDDVALPKQGKISVGEPEVDLASLQEGFNRPERDGSETFRWTDGQASLLVPPCRHLRLRVSAGRSATHFELSINEMKIARIEDLSFEPRDFEVGIPEILHEEIHPLRIEIASPFYSPAESGSIEDVRNLGIRLYSVEWFPHDPNDA
ncbi:MAG: hypothetical protein ACYTG7_18565 [Planctomycetota bacterium]|jgi:hypothetical protein